MAELTGANRARLRIEWIKRGKEGDFEEFVKKVCDAKGIKYKPPKKYVREEYAKRVPRKDVS